MGGTEIYAPQTLSCFSRSNTICMKCIVEFSVEFAFIDLKLLVFWKCTINCMKVKWATDEWQEHMQCLALHIRWSKRKTSKLCVHLPFREGYVSHMRSQHTKNMQFLVNLPHLNLNDAQARSSSGDGDGWWQMVFQLSISGSNWNSASNQSENRILAQCVLATSFWTEHPAKKEENKRKRWPSA